ncbi:APC family permease [Mucilaginibacter ginkgonis]|uniref:APC family permease n=1 Tax=Mucilaginibacter ginkgonis TaxID=2682091 RepID=A0A6I4HYX2_9SPHI|nr:APC family permease [Mucilaginibacter ginkgonis]QQL49293.1 APC family permease [Mucilaginibacter ginkgonis]
MAKGGAPKKIRLFQLVFIIFFTVSGGPYGLESLLSYAGSHYAIIILFVTPILWDVPAILTVAELNSMMPIEGGYYQWVKNALGLRFGFYEGWWTWLYTFIDLAIYPVMFVQYASYFFPWMQQWQLPVCLVFIWLSALINVWGIKQVGRISVILSVAVLGPFVVLFIAAMMHHTFAHPQVTGAATPLKFSSVGMALYIVMWNCLGWDNITTYAGEVEQPVRTYLKAVFIAFAMVIAIYLVTIFVAQRSGIDYNVLSNERFPVLGEFIAGKWLGALIAAGGMASAMGIYTAVLLSVSRIPMVMADDGLLPVGLTKTHSKYETPYRSIILCSLVISVMVLWSFDELVIIDVTVYGAGLFLEYVTLIVTRIKRPDAVRPFKIPLGITGLCIFMALPTLVYIAALGGTLIAAGSALKPLIFAGIALITAELGWQLAKRYRRKVVLND